MNLIGDGTQTPTLGCVTSVDGSFVITDIASLELTANNGSTVGASITTGSGELDLRANSNSWELKADYVPTTGGYANICRLDAGVAGTIQRQDTRLSYGKTVTLDCPIVDSGTSSTAKVIIGADTLKIWSGGSGATNYGIALSRATLKMTTSDALNGLTHPKISIPDQYGEVYLNTNANMYIEGGDVAAVDGGLVDFRGSGTLFLGSDNKTCELDCSLSMSSVCTLKVTVDSSTTARKVSQVYAPTGSYILIHGPHPGTNITCALNIVHDLASGDQMLFLGGADVQSVTAVFDTLVNFGTHYSLVTVGMDGDAVDLKYT